MERPRPRGEPPPARTPRPSPAESFPDSCCRSLSRTQRGSPPPALLMSRRSTSKTGCHRAGPWRVLTRRSWRRSRTPPRQSAQAAPRQLLLWPTQRPLAARSSTPSLSGREQNQHRIALPERRVILPESQGVEPLLSNRGFVSVAGRQCWVVSLLGGVLPPALVPS